MVYGTMIDKIKMAKINLKSLAAIIALSFFNAVNAVHIEPVFNEAAGDTSGDSGGAKWHAKDIIGIPGAKFHAMTGQAEGSQDVRRARAEGKAFRAQAIDRPDYYGSFEKTNNFTM